MSVTTRQVEWIECEDDEGNAYTVVVSQRFVTQKTMKGEGTPQPSTKSLELEDGRHVNMIDKDMTVFQILENDKIIRAKV